MITLYELYKGAEKVAQETKDIDINGTHKYEKYPEVVSFLNIDYYNPIHIYDGWMVYKTWTMPGYELLVRVIE